LYRIAYRIADRDGNLDSGNSVMFGLVTKAGQVLLSDPNSCDLSYGCGAAGVAAEKAKRRRSRKWPQEKSEPQCEIIDTDAGAWRAACVLLAHLGLRCAAGQIVSTHFR
jgi:hypothetical protein